MSIAAAASRTASGWRILADDLTGALDSAAAFSGAHAVPVFLRPADAVGAAAENRPDRLQIQVLATGTREVAQSELPDVLQACLPWLVAQDGSPCFSFKKVDSLLRGNTFAEIAWLARHGGFERIVFSPAFPAQGRFTEAGRHWTNLPHQPGDPGQRQALALLDAFSEVGLRASITHDLATAIEDDGEARAPVLIPDVLDDASLAVLAQLSQAAGEHARRWLWCGSAGLAWALARQWALAPHAADTVTPARGAAVVISASRHAVLRGQLPSLASLCERLQWPLHDPMPAFTVHGERALLLDLASEQVLSRVAAQALLTQQCRHIVEALPRPANLVVVGGDTLLALCQAAGTLSLSADPGPRTGWGRARLRGGVWDGVTCYSRSGAFGAPDDLSTLLESLTTKKAVP